MRIEALAVLLSITAGCATHFNQEVPDLKAAGAVTSTQVSPKAIKTSIPYEGLSKIKFAILVTHSNVDQPGLQGLIKNSLLSLGIPEVLDESEYARRIISTADTNVPGGGDLVSLNRASKAVGPFIVVEASVQNSTNGLWWKNWVSIVDPELPGTVYEYELLRPSLSGAEREINRPMINAIRSWYMSGKP